MNTRKQYLNNECTHFEYYSQFVNDLTKGAISRNIGLEKLLKSTDKHFNDINLKIWDSMPIYLETGEMEKYGDHFSLSGRVFIGKTAARMLVNEANQK